MEPQFTWPGWNNAGLIGKGSFGAVYEIQRNVFGNLERAALKVVTIPRDSSDIDNLRSDGYDVQSIARKYEEYLQDIVKEYSLMATMKGNSNIVDCDDLHYEPQENGIGWNIYIKMELLTPLTKYLDRGIEEEQVIKLAKDMCNALIVCKNRNVIHRDIKPQNIFVSADGDYKLGDFGIAKVAEKATNGTIIGTLKYMAPEVYNNQSYDFSADIYSLGLVLYWMLNERRTPFLPLPPATPTNFHEEEAKKRRFSGEPVPPPLYGSPALKKIVCKACAYDVNKRYRSADEMLDDLLALNDKDKPKPKPKPDGFLAAHFLPIALSLVALIVVLVASMLVIPALMGDSAEELSEQYCELGEEYLYDEEFSDAVDAFSDAVFENGENIDAYIGRAKAYYGIGEEKKLALAIDDLEMVIEMDETQVEAYTVLADIYMSMGDYEAALEVLEQAELNTDASYDDLYDGRKVKLYTPDGKSESVNLDEVPQLLEEGRYTEPVLTMYAIDGNTKVVKESEKEEYKKSGWYEEPVVTMYSKDGEEIVVPESEKEKYKKKGWYNENVVTMYAPDGRTVVIVEREVENYKKVGWYEEPVATLYAADGRTRVVAKTDVEKYKKLDWYEEPVVTMYAADGRTTVIKEKAIEDYKKVGWYEEPVVTMYAADGRTIVVKKTAVEDYIKVGWFTEPV